MQKEEILKKTNNGLDVFRHYITCNWRVGRNFLNPLYSDSKASCNIYYDRRSGTYKMKDFGNPEYSGDCFFLVAKLNGLDCSNAGDFVSVLQIIDRDLNLSLGTRQVSVATPYPSCPSQPLPSKELEKQVRKIPAKQIPKFTEQPFKDSEYQFWAASGITPDILNRFSVVSLKEYSGVNKDGNTFRIVSSLAEPMFAYKQKGMVKVYRPFSSLRFIYGYETTKENSYLFGLEQLPAKGDLLFITGGEKDVMSLTSHGFVAICFNSETANIPEDLIRRFSFRFKHIILLFDTDKTGIESSALQEEKLSAYGISRLVLPLPGTKEEKDITDFFRLGHTREELMKLFLNHLDLKYNETMSALKSCEIDFTNPPPIAQVIISAEGKVPLGTQGNLLCITGGEGCGKSNYIAAMIAGAIRPHGLDVDTLGITVHENEKSKAILYYDTEQSLEQLYKNMGNLLRRSGRKELPDYLHAYCLTGMSRKERLVSIIQSIDKFHYQYNGIYMIVIDGIADLIRGANDEAESIAIVEELYRLAGIYKTCIVTVLHFIPNGLKLRGHLGSELQRKAAAILSIEKDGNDTGVSVVKALKVRDGSPLDVPLMQFAWDKELGMHIYCGEKPREEKEKRKEMELLKVAREILGQQPYITYIDLCEQIQSVMDVKERTAKSYIKYMRDKEIILRDPSNNTHFIIGIK